MSALKQIKNLTEQIFKPKRLNTVVFFVTSICNEKCRHCFYFIQTKMFGHCDHAIEMAKVERVKIAPEDADSTVLH